MNISAYKLQQYDALSHIMGQMVLYFIHDIFMFPLSHLLTPSHTFSHLAVFVFISCEPGSLLEWVVDASQADAYARLKTLRDLLPRSASAGAKQLTACEVAPMQGRCGGGGGAGVGADTVALHVAQFIMSDKALARQVGWHATT